uniref:Uncharacterized protein n=1 Tax=mine drainage metagenome TaxID=410659 RepID=E6PMH1_9ZZZZ
MVSHHRRQRNLRHRPVLPAGDQGPRHLRARLKALKRSHKTRMNLAVRPASHGPFLARSPAWNRAVCDKFFCLKAPHRAHTLIASSKHLLKASAQSICSKHLD